MSFITLDFGATTTNGSGNPVTLEVLLNGSVVSSVDMQTGASDYYIILDLENGSSPTLSLRFSGTSGGLGDNIEFTSFHVSQSQINVNTDLSNNILTQSQTTSVPVIIVSTGSAQGSHSDDIVSGTTSNDTLTGRGGGDTLYGGGGDDILRGQGQSDTDTLYGEAGNDLLYGDVNDNLYGGDGDDTLRATGGTGIIDGGNGIDKVWWRDAATAMTVDLVAGTATDGNGNVATISNIENILGSSFADTLTGDNNDNNIFGGDGSDILRGGGGNDDIRGQGAAGEVDYLYGEAGDDILYGELNDELYGGDGNDILRAIGGTGVLDGGNNTDLVWWRNATGSINVDLAAGTATDNVGNIATILNVERIRGSSFADTLLGTSGDDVLDGGINFGGNIDQGDTIEGRGGNDTIFGRSGDDILLGGTGNDTIYGGEGNDTIRGGDQTIIGINSSNLLSYGGSQDAGGVITYLDDDVGVALDGNLWKRILVNYEITANTVIEFDYRSTVEAEISGIGFDTDNNISSDRTFKLYGDQSWGIGAFENYDGSGNWTHYTIDVGSYYTGTFSHLTLVNDDDGGGDDGDGYFKNIIIYETNESGGNNNLYAAEGSDDLYGDTGIDRFIFENTAGIDNLHYFTEDHGDILDLSNILSFSSGSIADYVSLTNSGDHMTLGIDASGTASFTTIAELRGVNDLDVATLYANGQIIA